MLAIHSHSHPGSQLLNIFFEDAGRNTVGRLQDHKALFLHEDVLEFY
jgi:hypothetical protein